MASNCLFCRIFTGEEKVRKVYEDENTIAILDKSPRFAQGQCLVIHRRHVEQFYELEDDEIAELFKTVKIVAKKLKRAFDPQFVCLFTRGQGIPHSHIIVFPSSPFTTLDGFFSSQFASIKLATESDSNKLDEVAKNVRNA